MTKPLLPVRDGADAESLADLDAGDLPLGQLDGREIGDNWAGYSLAIFGRPYADEVRHGGWAGPISSRGLPQEESASVLVFEGRSVYRVPEYAVTRMVVRVPGVGEPLVWRFVPGTKDGAIFPPLAPSSRRKRQLIRKGRLLIDEVIKRGRRFDSGNYPAVSEFEDALERALLALPRQGRGATMVQLTRPHGPDVLFLGDRSVLADNLTRAGLQWTRDIKSGNWIARRRERRSRH